MFQDASTRTGLVILICAVPAALRWWWGLGLARLASHPVLPERLLAHQRRNLAVHLAAIVAIGIVGRYQDLFWALPLTLFLRAAAAYPLRRALFDERWSLPRYLWSMTRLVVAMWGFWLVLASVPALARMAGRFDWLAALALAILLGLWTKHYSAAFSRLTGAKPIADAALDARFNAVADASTAARPRFEVVDLRGGAIVNAVALPGRGVSRVLFTDTLLRLMDADESTAIVAHEIAHLEYYDAARLRRLGLATWALIAIAALSGAAANRLFPALAIETHALLWLLTMVTALVWIARDRQKNETSSDLRALELTGDADALVRALTKLHEFARVPRRWNTEMERHATHPSLARRIRAIRAASGVAHAGTLDAPETIAGLDGTTIVTFNRDRLEWHEGDAATHLLAYAHLTELRVDARASGRMRLVAVERGGRSWALRLADAEAARAQAILNRIDGALGEPAIQSSAAQILRFAGAIVAICALSVGQVLVAFLALAAAVLSTTALTAAAGAASLSAAWILASDAVMKGDTGSLWAIALLAILGAGLIAGAPGLRQSGTRRAEGAAIAAVALFAALSLAFIGTQAANAVRLYQASIATPSATILPLALAAAFAFTTRRALRLLAAPIAAIGLVMGAAGTGAFLHAFGRDPFLVKGEPLAIETLDSLPVAELSLDERAAGLRVSPSGRHVAVMAYPGDEESTWPFHVGRPGEPMVPVKAQDFAFVDDELALTLTMEGTDVVVRELALDSLEPVREHRLEQLYATQLSYDPAGRRWRVLGTDYSNHVVSVEGRVGISDFQRQRWPKAESTGWQQAGIVTEHGALIAETEVDLGPLEDHVWRMPLLADFNRMRTTVRRHAAGSTSDLMVSHLQTTCSDRLFDGRRLVCAAFDGARTQIVTIEAAGGAAVVVGSVAGRFVGEQSSGGTWLTGWAECGPVAIDVSGRRALTTPRGFDADQIAVSTGAVAVLDSFGDSARVRIYRPPARAR